MEYQTIFDVTTAGYRQAWFPALGLVMVVVSLIFVKFRHLLRPQSLRFITIVGAIFAGMWTIGALLLTLFQYLSLTSALREGRCTVTEGVISDYQPTPKGGRGSDFFTVDHRVFQLSDQVVSPGFRRTLAYGSPLRVGLRIRVHHVGNDIARLEIDPANFGTPP